MLIELKTTLDLLKNINEKSNKNIISQHEFSEQFENLVEFEEVIKEFNQQLFNLRNTNLTDTDSVVEKLVHIHLKFEKLIWQFDEIHELVKKLVGNYRE